MSNHGRTITVVGRSADVELWAMGGLLPRTGASTWAVRVDHSRSNDGNGLWVGVCDAAARCSWGLFLLSGRMRCASQDADGRLAFGAAPTELVEFEIVAAPARAKHPLCRTRLYVPLG